MSTMSGDINNVVLGTVHMYLDKGTMGDVVEIIESNFDENELREAVVKLHEAIGEASPGSRQTSSTRTAVHAYACDIHEKVSALVAQNKLPVIVVSSDQLARIPMSKKKMDNSDVNSRLETLETMMKSVVGNLEKLVEKPTFAAAVKNQPRVPQGANGGGHLHPLRGGNAGLERSRSPSTKRGHDQVGADGQSVGAGGTGGGGGAGGGAGGAGGGGAGGQYQTVPPRRQLRKVTYGTKNIAVDGAEAAPVDIFIGNTNPRATKEIVAAVLKNCAEDMPDNLKLEIIDVRCLTNPERDPNPRTRSWVVRVPYKFKSLMENVEFYPSGCSHRKYFPPRNQGNKRMHMDSNNDPVSRMLDQQVGNSGQ